MPNKPPKQWFNPKTRITFFDLGVDPEVKYNDQGKPYRLRKWKALGCRVCHKPFVIAIAQSKHPSKHKSTELVTCPDHRGQAT